ncbi:unnamed protein product [Penicillium glandicola]
MPLDRLVRPSSDHSREISLETNRRAQDTEINLKLRLRELEIALGLPVRSHPVLPRSIWPELAVSYHFGQFKHTAGR